MAIITSGDFASFLRPGVESTYGLKYKEKPEQWRDIYQVNMSDMFYEEDVGLKGFGLASTMSQGGGVSFADMSQGMKYRYVHQKYGLGYIVSEQAVRHAKFVPLLQNGAMALAKSMRHTKETVAANILNNGFSSSVNTFADGLALFSTAHLTQSGATFANKPTSDSDLSEEALENMIHIMDQWIDEGGLYVAAKARKLIVHPSDYLTAQRILGTEYKTGTADNDINVITKYGYIPEGVVSNQFLTDSDAYFLLTDVDNGMKMYQNLPVTISSDTEFTTDNMRFKAVEMYSFGCTDLRGIIGNQGG